MTSQPVSAPAAPPAEVPAPISPVREAAGALVTANGPSRRPSRLPKARRLSRRSKILIGLGLGLFVAVILYLVYYFITRPRDVRADLVTHKVQYGRLEMTIVERGALESANNHDIVCRVKAKNQQSQVSTTIKWIIDDGSQVKHDRPTEEALSILTWDAKNAAWFEKPVDAKGTARVVEQPDEQTGQTVYSDLLVELDDSGLI